MATVGVRPLPWPASPASMCAAVAKSGERNSTQPASTNSAVSPQAAGVGSGRPFFQELPEHVRLRLIEAVAAPGVTHLRYEVQR